MAAERIPLRDFEHEDERFFEACLPVEVLAGRGSRALAFGPLRPVGLRDPRTGKRPYAVVQLRQDNLAGTLYNLVGFQTNLRWGEQKRVFGLIPGLEHAEWVRYGQMHRNTYLNAPRLLEPSCSGATRDLFFAGQIIGTEGYVGSTASGLVAGINAARVARVRRRSCAASHDHAGRAGALRDRPAGDLSADEAQLGPAAAAGARLRRQAGSQCRLRSARWLIWRPVVQDSGVLCDLGEMSHEATPAERVVRCARSRWCPWRVVAPAAGAFSGAQALTHVTHGCSHGSAAGRHTGPTRGGRLYRAKLERYGWKVERDALPIAA